ncbi:MAG: phosphate/phosphite/phosphonate ABC transporter substrate-binding protein [Gammaproteobacteria bacterium]|nr:phosphate/phosphite/phosphonate ABC transporter substrate-binding protein [Gammaproteobacteria bacterium]
MKIKTIILLMVLPVFVQAADQGDDVIIFTAPPRGTLSVENETYQPIADYLSRVLQKKVIYRQPLSWMHYQKEMVENKYHIVFDGPHFVSWRMNHTNHIPLVKLPQPLVWVIIARKDDTRTNALKDLEGRGFCGHPSPNLGTLTVRSLMNTATREPRLVVRKGWHTIYKGVVNEKACVAGALPKTNLYLYDPELKHTKIIYEHQPYPNQAITISNKFDTELRDKVRASLLSKEGQNSMAKLRKRYTKGDTLVKANKDEYRYVTNVLNEVYGYGYNFVDKDLK